MIGTFLIDACREGISRVVSYCEGQDLSTADFRYCGFQNRSTIVFGPDAADTVDNGCLDIYTNNVVLYEGRYLMQPTAYRHFPQPPNWCRSNDGLLDVRLAHSTDGRAWSYVGATPAVARVGKTVGGDRRAWLERSSCGLPVNSLTQLETVKGFLAKREAARSLI